MGTWSEAILGNDTSCEVRERFIELYDNGENPENIANIVLNEQQSNLEYDRTNVWLGLAFVCWECKLLTREILSEIRKIVETGEDIEFCKELEADSKFIKKREKVLNDFLIKISKEKDKPRLRKKPPIQIESDYKAGVCLSFHYPSGNYGGVIIIDSQLFKNSGGLRFAFTNINQKEKPDFQTFLNAKLIDFSWKTVYGQSQKYAAFDNFTARISTESIGYEKETKNNFFEYNSNFFEIAGKLPAFTQCLLATSVGGSLYKESYQRFEKMMSESLYYTFDYMVNRNSNSKETIEELSKLLVNN